MKKEIGWRERKKEGRGLFFSSSDIDNLIFTITILKKRRVLASIDQAVQPQSNIQKCDWDGSSPVRYIDMTYRLSIYRHF